MLKHFWFWFARKMANNSNNNSVIQAPFLRLLSSASADNDCNNSILGVHGFVEYMPGDTNLIISVPHGGDMRPPFMDDRTKSKFITLATLNGEEISKSVSDEESFIDEDDDTSDKISTVADIFTKEIAQTLVSEFEILTSRKPHLILANIHRSKVDPNRPIENAALGNKLAEAVYKDYHKFIVEAKTRVEGPGLLIDLHGQNHHQNSIEIGYLYTKTMLNQGNYSSLVSGPSVRALLARHQLTPASLLLGDLSLGAMFEAAGYRACPSPRQPCPGRDRYYKGGYITQTHGSSGSQPQPGHNQNIDAIQLELPAEVRHGGGPERREQFARSCAQVLVKFMETYYSPEDTL